MMDKGGVKYVNVFVTSPAGIKHARESGLASSGLADVVSSHLFTGSMSLFTEENKGKAFTIFRHPIERAISLFYYLGSDQAKHERTYDAGLKTMTIQEFALTNKVVKKFSTLNRADHMLFRMLSEMNLFSSILTICFALFSHTYSI